MREQFITKISKDKMEELNQKLSQDVLDIYRDWHLRPSLAYPPEIKNGVPKGRENSTIFQIDLIAGDDNAIKNSLTVIAESYSDWVYQALQIAPNEIHIENSNSSL